MKKKQDKQLLVFSYGLPLICFVLAWRQYAKHGPTFWIEFLIAIGTIVLLAALFAKPLVEVLFKYWMKGVQLIGQFVTTCILTVFFICVITPIGIILRWMGNDFMRMRPKNHTDSYWIKREQDKGSNVQQF